MRRLTSLVFALLLTLTLASTALAGSCANLSRAPAACGFSCTTLVVQGNWVWLPSLANVGVPGLPPFWGFIAPGGADAVEIGVPSAAGNYQNGYSISLLGRSAYCLKQVNNDRTHGIVSGCE